jgi:hypothetical protein
MKLIELKNWVNSLPDEFLEYSVVNGETGKIDEDYHFRVDKPATTLLVDKENKEIVILNDSEMTEDEIKELMEKENKDVTN